MADRNDDNIFERLWRNNGVGDFKNATPELKFKVCQVTIESILKILQSNREVEIPEQSLTDFTNSLLQISNVLYELERGPLGPQYPFGQLRKPIDEARTNLDAALSIFRKDNVLQRVQYIQQCRVGLEQAKDIIEGFPSDLLEIKTPEISLPKVDIDSTDPTINPSLEPAPSPESLEIIKQGLENAENNAIDDTAVGSKDDKLNFGIYVDALYDFITSQDTSTPLTISINGPWGMGKSSLMKMLREKLEPPEGKRYRIDSTQSNISPSFQPTVWFNAWKYSQEEQLWAALALEVMNQIKQKYSIPGKLLFWSRLTFKRFSIIAALWNIIKKVALPLILGYIAWNYSFYVTQILSNIVLNHDPKAFLQQFGSIISLGGPLLWIGALVIGIIQINSIVKDPFQISVKDIIDKPNYRDKVGFLGNFELDFSRIVYVVTHPLRQKPQKLVIFIDDLDRCRPFQVVSIVEAISLFLDSKYCVFVVGMDPAAITTNIEAKYTELVEKMRRETPGIVSPGSLFLDKIIQISFNIPRPSQKDIDFLIEGITRQKGKSPSINSQDNIRLVEGITDQTSLLQNGQESATPQPTGETINTPIKDVASFERNDVQVAIKIASRYLKENPRLVKKFINIFRLKVYLADKLDMLHGQSLTPLAVMVAWIMQWPEIAKLLLDEAHSSDVIAYLVEICEHIQENGNWKESITAQEDQQGSISEIDQLMNEMQERHTKGDKNPAHWCHLPWDEWIRDKDFRCCLKFMEKEKLWQQLRMDAQSEEILNLAQLMRI